MFSWAEQCIESATKDVENLVSDATGVPNHDPVPENTNAPLYSPFQLPIQYLDKHELHTLLPTVSNDLELYNAPGEQSVYDIVFQPSNLFARDIFQEWNRQYTSNIPFLEESQQIITETPLDEYPLKYECGRIPRIANPISWKNTGLSSGIC